MEDSFDTPLRSVVDPRRIISMQQVGNIVLRLMAVKELGEETAALLAQKRNFQPVQDSRKRF